MNTTATSQNQVNLWEYSASSGTLTTFTSAVQLLLNFFECEHISARSDLNLERHVQDWNVLLLDNVCISRNLRWNFMFLMQHDDADNICFFCYCLTTYVSFIFSAVDNNADIVEQNWSTDDWHHIYITLDLRELINLAEDKNADILEQNGYSLNASQCTSVKNCTWWKNSLKFSGIGFSFLSTLRDVYH